MLRDIDDSLDHIGVIAEIGIPPDPIPRPQPRCTAQFRIAPSHSRKPDPGEMPISPRCASNSELSANSLQGTPQAACDFQQDIVVEV